MRSSNDNFQSSVGINISNSKQVIQTQRLIFRRDKRIVIHIDRNQTQAVARRLHVAFVCNAYRFQTSGPNNRPVVHRRDTDGGIDRMRFLTPSLVHY
jgi:phosphatidylserine/phosphatidylglycerophosphate/cardiolipin synthase-like enzyme